MHLNRNFLIAGPATDWRPISSCRVGCFKHGVQLNPTTGNQRLAFTPAGPTQLPFPLATWSGTLGTSQSYYVAHVELRCQHQIATPLHLKRANIKYSGRCSEFDLCRNLWSRATQVRKKMSQNASGPSSVWTAEDFLVPQWKLFVKRI